MRFIYTQHTAPHLHPDLYIRTLLSHPTASSSTSTRSSQPGEAQPQSALASAGSVATAGSKSESARYANNQRHKICMVNRILPPNSANLLTAATSEPCMRGHRSSKCTHTDRILVQVRKPGRPLSEQSTILHGNER